MSEKYFHEQQSLVNYFFEQIDFKQVEDLAQKILDCQGLTVLCGVGKSGHVARNLSQLLVSVGFKSIYMSPTDALHGDIGILGKKDNLILISKSGNTEELVQLVPIARQKGAYLISLICRSGSKLYDLSDQSVILPLQKELCPYNLAPLTSSAIQMIFGNTLIAYLMSRSKISRDEYALNHPSGQIGKKLLLKVKDLMIPVEKLALGQESDRLVDHLTNMSDKRCGCLLIHENLNLTGIFTDGDLRRILAEDYLHGLSKTFSEVMVREPVTIYADCPIYLAIDIMEHEEESLNGPKKKRVKELPVIDEQGKILGLITLHDLVQAGLKN